MSNTNVDEPIKVEVATLKFFDGLEVEVYKMPDGEFRIGLTGASLVLGYGENWLPRLLRKKEGISLKALLALGFSKKTQKVVSEPTIGSKKVETIGLDDFDRLIVYTVSRHKKAALALQQSLTEVPLVDFFLAAFGKAPLNMEQKRHLFYEKYAVTISPDGWRQMSKRDIVRLALHTGLSHSQKNNNVIDGVSLDSLPPIDDSIGVKDLELITESFIVPKNPPKLKDDFFENWVDDNRMEIAYSVIVMIISYGIILNKEEYTLGEVYLSFLYSGVGTFFGIKLVSAIWRFFCNIAKNFF
jgi:hypothetical protein